MQQFSGSSGFGGTRTPAISVDFAKMVDWRSEVEERRGPKTRRAREALSRSESGMAEEEVVEGEVASGAVLGERRVGVDLATAGRRRERVSLRES
jgi:hypothetical protein